MLYEVYNSAGHVGGMINKVARQAVVDTESVSLQNDIDHRVKCER